MTTISSKSFELETTATARPLVCACVVTYNGKEFLEKCFESLRELTDYSNVRLVLIDNGSSDGSGDYVRENFPEVDVLRVSPNVGYAHGANEAIHAARGLEAKYVVIMNDDIAILHPQWLSEAVAYAQRDPNIGVIGFAQSTSANERAVASAELTEEEYISSPVLMFPVEMFERLGLFDEAFYLGCEEDDLAARAQAAGYGTFMLDIPVYHFVGGTHQNHSRRAAYLQMRNGIRFCLKNRSIAHALRRAARIVDVACNPWPLSFNEHDGAHVRMRNSGNGLINGWLLLKAVVWNVGRMPQTFRIRAAERQQIGAARAAREVAAAALSARVSLERSEKFVLEPVEVGV